jgi:CheY-like chemotaxis protein
MKMNENEVNLTVLMSDLYEQFKPKTELKGVELRFRSENPEKCIEILTDRTKLIQILSNLICNALKFTDNGHIEFGFKLKDRDIEFYVEDTGIGIRNELHTKIFERFYQVDYSGTRKYDGTGLGLSISKAYIDLAGGKIWVNSQPTKGATFYFTIPLISVLNQSTELSENVWRDTSTSSHPKTILIVEDMESNYILIKALLSTFNVKLIHAANGKEAVKLCNSDIMIDLVLMDIKMPEMDGYEATKLIKSSRPDLPVIAKTAYANESDKKNALDCGCIDFISKPFAKDKFLNMVCKHLGIKKSVLT